MAPLWRMGVGIVVVLTFLYRLAFHDSRVSNFETPPGYSAAKSIAQIEADEQKAFEKALTETGQEKDKDKDKDKERVAEASPVKSKSPAQTVSVVTKKLMKSVKNFTPKKWLSKKLAKLSKLKWKKEIR